MDNRDNQDNPGSEDKFRVDVLADRFELYQTMSTVFFRRLNKEEKIDALLEVIDIMKTNLGE